MYCIWLAAIRCAVKNISINHSTFNLSHGCTKAFLKLKESCEENTKSNYNNVLYLKLYFYLEFFKY